MSSWVIFLTGHMTGQPFNSVNWLVKPWSSQCCQYLTLIIRDAEKINARCVSRNSYAPLLRNLSHKFLSGYWRSLWWRGLLLEFIRFLESLTLFMSNGTLFEQKSAIKWSQFWAKIANFDVVRKMKKICILSAPTPKLLHFPYQVRFLAWFSGFRFFWNFFRVATYF